jgi:hypothetical protein
MKKLIVAIVLLVYGLTSTGAIVHLDYCCGKISKVSLSHSQKEACKEKTISGKSCCDSKDVQIKVKGDQMTTVKWVNMHKQFSSTSPGLATSFTQIILYTPVNEFSTGPPLIASTVPLFIQHCLFLI